MTTLTCTMEAGRPAKERITSSAKRALDAANGASAPGLSTLDALEAELIAAEIEWRDKADLTDSVKASNEGREVTSEDEALWQATSDRHWKAVDALIEYTPLTPSELLRKAKLLTNEGDTLVRTEEQFGELYLRDAEAVSQMAISAVMAVEHLRPAWDAALAAYHSARAAYDAASAEWDALDAEITARAPAWNRKPRITDDKPVVRWSNIGQFERDTDVLPHVKAVHEPMLNAWLQAEAPHLDRLQELGSAIDDIYDRVCDTERALIETPAPDLAAVILKQRLFGVETDDYKRGYSDPAYAAARRDTSYVVQAWPLWIHEDVLRLAGVPDPILTTDHFKPRQWKNRFEAAGGTAKVTSIKHELSLGMPREPEAAARLLAELAAPGATEALTRYLVELLT